MDVIADAPGVALLEDQTTVTGLDALATAASEAVAGEYELLARPEHAAADASVASRRHDGRRRIRAGRDFARALQAGHTKACCSRCLQDDSREQLGLLLGVINETGCVSRVSSTRHSLHAASSRRRRECCISISNCIRRCSRCSNTSGGEHPGLKRSRYEIALRHGLLGIQQTLAQFIAENFVRKTRFDPLHEAGSEQRLVDQLPAWLSELQQAEAITMSFQFGERELQLEMERAADHCRR